MNRNFGMEKIVSDLSAGSKPAFKKIFRLYSPRLIRYAGFLLKDNDEAEDLVQEVFFEVWKNRNARTVCRSIPAKMA